MFRLAIDADKGPSSKFAVNEKSPASLVAARLRRSGYPYLWHIHCHDRNGVTVLSGQVPTFHLKQLAQELAIHTVGVRRVDNQVQVSVRPGYESQLG